MDDKDIIELYWQRNELAIRKSEQRYGAYCLTIANSILSSKEDTEECVNDTWVRAWNTIPPERPSRLALFFGRITRNLAIDRYRNGKTKKHGAGQINCCLDELSECIGEQNTIEDTVALRELMNTFLCSLEKKNRDIFLLRYWYMMPVKEIAERYEASEGAVKMLLKRVREKLRIYLEAEGVGL